MVNLHNFTVHRGKKKVVGNKMANFCDRIEHSIAEGNNQKEE